jgi:hypothetical protein
MQDIRFMDDFMQPVMIRPAVKMLCGVGIYILDCVDEED